MNIDMTQLEDLYGLGFSMLWLHPNSKRPIDTGWTKAPRPTWDTFRRLYVPSANVGVRLGSNTKLNDGTFLAVIDCDVKSDDPVHQEEMKRALDSLGFDWVSAPTVKSGRGNGSRHIYIKTTEPQVPKLITRSAHPVKVYMPSAKNVTDRDRAKLSVSEVAEGYRVRPAWEISLMGTGQQVVLPPSIHPDTGLPYVLEGRGFEIPFPLVDLQIEKINKDTKVKTIRDVPEYQNVLVDLVSADIPEWAWNLLVKGQGLERYHGDKSAALYAVALVLINAQFTDLEIMTVLTDPNHILARASYDHAKTRDRKRAASWIYKYTVVKARYEKSAAKAFEDEAIVENVILEPEEALAQEKELLGNWREQLDRNPQTLRPKSTLKNVILVLENFNNGPIFTFDVFLQSELYCARPPWSDSSSTKWEAREITDSDLTRIKDWFGRSFGFEPSTENIAGAISVVSRRNAKHPVRDYLHGLNWDGTERLNNWLFTYLNAETTDDKHRRYVQAVGRKMLVGAVARVMNPGCKWDYVPILEGNQGMGKSTACSILAGSWFSDSIGDITNKDVVEAMRGKWLIELGELAVMRRHEVENLKHFVTVRYDNVRKAYARKSEEFPRQCIFIGTTNRSDYFQDETGNRRYWPVKVHRVDFAKLQTDRDQLWAEAVEAWANGEELFLRGELEETAKTVQASKLDRDEWEGIIAETLQDDDFMTPNGFVLLELWKRMMKLSDPDGMKFGKAQQHRMGRCLRLMGYEVKVVWAGKSERRWFKPGGSA